MRGYKGFWVWGGERNEHLYLTLPSDELSYWKNIQKKLNLVGNAPKNLNIRLLYPYFDKAFRKDLPFESGRVTPHYFTIPFNSVKSQNIMHVMGSMGSQDEAVWLESLDAMKRNDGPIRLANIAESLSRKNQTIFRSFIKPLCENRLLQSDSCPYNLDMLKEFQDRDSITIFCLEFIPEEYRIFVLEWILSQMKSVLDKHRGMNNNVINLSEPSEFFRATDDSIMPERYKVFRRSLTNYIRMGRRGMHFILDSQSPSETKGIVAGQDDYTLLFRMTSQSDVETATDNLRRVGLVRDDQIRRLYRLEKGQALFLKSGEPAREIYFFKPRTKYWTPGVGDFYKYTWEKFSGGWKDMSAVSEDIRKMAGIEEINLVKVKPAKKVVEEEEIKEEKEKLWEQGI